METNLRSLNLSLNLSSTLRLRCVDAGRCSESFQPLEAAPSAAISRKLVESAILSDLLYLIGPHVGSLNYGIVTPFS